MRGLFLFFALFLLTGCGPKYVVQKEYAIGQGQEACVAQCQVRQESCVLGCQERLEACQAHASERARDRFYEASKQFKQDEAHYQLQWRSYRENRIAYDYLASQLHNDYRFFTLTCKDKKDAYACARAKELAVFQKNLVRQEPLAPLTPLAPNLAQILEQEVAGCDKSCGCSEGFDGCFVACGGSVVLQSICVERCN